MNQEKSIPTVREETAADQIHNGMLGADDTDYIEGEMVRVPVATDIVHAEVVPDPVLKPRRAPNNQEEQVEIHGIDSAMHDEEVRAQNPPIVVD